MPLRFRLAQGEDEDALLLLSQARIEASTLTREELRSYLAHPEETPVYVLEEENQIVAYLLLRLYGEEAEIDEIAVSFSFEGKGRGTFLLQEGERRLAQEGVKRLFLEVRRRNVRAVRFYERNGFTPYRTRKNYYGDDDAVCYRKEIGEHEG
jgi:ribosomal-protein-alanine N-acetyltransferase